MCQEFVVDVDMVCTSYVVFLRIEKLAERPLLVLNCFEDDLLR